MELKQLEAFVNVVELQSFSKAAKVIYLTQPTVSAHIVSLEKELNTKLLERTTKSVSLTQNGEKLYAYAKTMVSLKEEMMMEFCSQKASEIMINIAASTIPSLYVLPELIPAFQKKVAAVHFSLIQGDSEDTIKAVLTHKADIGFVGMYAADKRLQCIPFLEDSLVVIMPNEEKYQEILSGSQENIWDLLLKEPMILRENGSGTRKEAEKFLEARGIREEQLNVIAHINEQEMIKRSVSKGMGISIISRKAAEDYAEIGKLLIYEPPGGKIIRNLYLIYEKRKRFGSVIKQFIIFSQQYYE